MTIPAEGQRRPALRRRRTVIGDSFACIAEFRSRISRFGFALRVEMVLLATAGVVRTMNGFQAVFVAVTIFAVDRDETRSTLVVVAELRHGVQSFVVVGRVEMVVRLGFVQAV